MPFGMGPAGWAYVSSYAYLGAYPRPAFYYPFWARRGGWRGWGRGFGWRWWWPPFAWAWALPSKEDEVAMLEEQSRILEHELERIKKRLEDLKK
jgi:hypothetical protein